MAFRETLEEMVLTVGGGLGAVIMGYDGIAIDEYIASETGIDLQLLSVEYSNVIKEIRSAVEVLKTGMLEEVVISTDMTKVLVRGITDDFFLLLLLANDGNLGKGRYYLKKYAPVLRDSLQ